MRKEPGLLNKCLRTLRTLGPQETFFKMLRYIGFHAGFITQQQYSEGQAQQMEALRRELYTTYSESIAFIGEWHAENAQHFSNLSTAKDKPTTLISIIMPTYNREALIEKAIRSVLAQTYTNWELLIIDDGSTDNTAHVIAPFLVDERIHYLKCQHHGVCATRNEGLKNCKGDIVTYLDTDNTWYKHFLYTVALQFQEHPQYQTLYLARLRDNSFNKLTTIEFMSHFDFNRYLQHGGIDLNIFAHRRKLYDELGGFDKTLSSLVDYDLILRYTAKHSPLSVPLIGAHYFSGSWQTITNSENYFYSLYQLKRKWLQPLSTATQHVNRALFDPELFYPSTPKNEKLVLSCTKGFSRNDTNTLTQIIHTCPDFKFIAIDDNMPREECAKLMREAGLYLSLSNNNIIEAQASGCHVIAKATSSHQQTLEWSCADLFTSAQEAINMIKYTCDWTKEEWKKRQKLAIDHAYFKYLEALLPSNNTTKSIYAYGE